MSNKRVDYKKIITKKNITEELLKIEPLLSGIQEYQAQKIVSTLLEIIKYHLVIKEEVVRLKGIGDISTKKYKRKVTRSGILADTDILSNEEVREKIRLHMSRSISKTLKFKNNQAEIKNLKQISKNKNKAKAKAQTISLETEARNFLKLIEIEKALKKSETKWGK